MTIIYEVNLKVAQTILAEYLSWLQDHIQQMCQEPGFLSATLFEDITEVKNSQPSESSYIVQYEVASMEDLQHYFDKRAQVVRQEAIERFGENFNASRRVLKKI
ncbi:MAG: DUF4286 family protein [Proteobacteria bacterium]|nr:DUF4286 family protein [Pseudomonadota bacterium]